MLSSCNVTITARPSDCSSTVATNTAENSAMDSRLEVRTASAYFASTRFASKEFQYIYERILVASGPY